MKYAKLWVLLVALIVGAVAIYLGAQAKSETKTVTGCLQKGDEPNEYSILGYLVDSSSPDMLWYQSWRTTPEAWPN